MLPKVEIGTLDMTSNGNEAWVIFTRASEGGGPTSAWIASLPDGTPEPMYEGEDDACSIHFAAGLPEQNPAVGVATFDGSLAVFVLGTRGAKHKFHIAGPSGSGALL